MEISDNIKKANKTTRYAHQDQNTAGGFFSVCSQRNTSQKTFYQKPVIHTRNLKSLQGQKQDICYTYTSLYI